MSEKEANWFGEFVVQSARIEQFKQELATSRSQVEQLSAEVVELQRSRDAWKAQALDEHSAANDAEAEAERLRGLAQAVVDDAAPGGIYSLWTHWYVRDELIEQLREALQAGTEAGSGENSDG